MGEVPATETVHWADRLGLAGPPGASLRPDSPLSSATNAQVLLSDGFTHTAGAVNTSLPCGKVIENTSPPVKPGPPCPLRLSRLSRRSTLSLPACNARCGYLPELGKMAGAVLPISTSLSCRYW